VRAGHRQWPGHDSRRAVSHEEPLTSPTDDREELDMAESGEQGVRACLIFSHSLSSQTLAATSCLACVWFLPHL
jgi:hypothetical protein